MSFYPIALAVAIACFSTYPLLFKKYVNNANLFGLILILVLFTAVGAALPSVVFLFSASISYLSWLTMIAIGLLNSAAFYLEKGQA
jgi:hypothetical protein